MKALSISIFMLLPVILFAQLKGKVVGVADGDTFTLLTEDNVQVKIRLHGIDCPEKAQDFGQVAKQFTSGQIFGEIVSVEETDRDRYGRTVGVVFLPNGKILNEELLKAGLAWHYAKYDKNPVWLKLEQNARNSRTGLWTMNNPTAPWDWRKHTKNKVHNNKSAVYH